MIEQTIEQKKDTEKIQEILKKYEFRQVKGALSEIYNDLMPKVHDFTNEGEECSHNVDGCIGKEEFAQNEQVWGQNNLLSAHFLTEGSETQKAIAMVTLKVPKSGLPAGNGWASGFLISNSLFMTNNHVIPNKSFCNDVNMQFMYQDNYNTQPAIASEFFETNENSFFHTSVSLDYTIVRLKRKPYIFKKYGGLYKTKEDITTMNDPTIEETTMNDYADAEQVEELKYLNDFITKKKPIALFDMSKFLQIFGYTPGNRFGSIQLRPIMSYPIGLRLNIIQHPQGRKKEVVVQQNELKDVHTNVIHYYSDTDYGSSGSPVFNNTWDLMALHHARNLSESTNEGIRIDKIVTDLRNEFHTSNPGILAELGI